MLITLTQPHAEARDVAGDIEVVRLWGDITILRILTKPAKDCEDIRTDRQREEEKNNQDHSVHRQHRWKRILLDAELYDVPLTAEHTAEYDARIAEGKRRL